MPHFHIHVRAWGKLKRLCDSGDYIFSVSPFLGDFGQELFCKACHGFVISHTKGNNWDGTDFKIGVGTRCSEYSEWTLYTFFGCDYH